MKGRLIKKININNIFLSVWENEAIVDGKKVTIVNITIKRSYKNKNTGQWAFTDNFSEKHLPNIKEVIERYEDDIHGN